MMRICVGRAVVCLRCVVGVAGGTRWCSTQNARRDPERERGRLPRAEARGRLVTHSAAAPGGSPDGGRQQRPD
jgi:hypothetical protein